MDVLPNHPGKKINFPLHSKGCQRLQQLSFTERFPWARNPFTLQAPEQEAYLPGLEYLVWLPRMIPVNVVTSHTLSMCAWNALGNVILVSQMTEVTKPEHSISTRSCEALCVSSMSLPCLSWRLLRVPKDCLEGKTRRDAHKYP